jgi:hypothetical protein
MSPRESNGKSDLVGLEVVNFVEIEIARVLIAL